MGLPTPSWLVPRLLLGVLPGLVPLPTRAAPACFRPPAPTGLDGFPTLGLAPAGAPMERMLLALKLTPGAAARLERCLAELGDPASPDYHRWLTPEQFGARFGPGPEALARVETWLRAGGFRVDGRAASRLSLTFSGTVAQVERHFRTRIQRFQVDGRTRQGSLRAPAIPLDLAGLVAGVVSLHDQPRPAQNLGFAAPDPAGHALTPGDFATIYNASPLHREGIDGRGVSIAIVGRTRFALADAARFRRNHRLPPGAPEIIVNGPDPGFLGAGEEGEANLDVQWAGAAAPGASIRFVASASTGSTDGVDLSARYIVDHNLAAILSTSFGQCEQRMGTAGQTFYRNLWAQAAAQGITVVAASGDSGPAGCDSGLAGTGSGRAVSGLASTPYNLAVGGTQMEEGSGCYWRTSPDPDGISALGYIPERAWNESASSPGGAGLWATGGGTSTLYAKPAWQIAPGVPADAPQYQFRCLPDLALSAAMHHDGYLVETGGCTRITGGTSCSAPAFAGLMALVVQKAGRQGNAGPALYRLGRAQYQGTGPVVFHDITAGANCVPGTQGYSCTPGYDLATGLGSLDAQALVGAWAASSGANVDAGILQPAADLSVASGTRVAFRGRARSSEPGATLAYAWDFGDGGTGSAASCSHIFLNPGSIPLSNLVALTVRDGSGAQGSDTRSITVLPAPAPGERIVNGGFELGAGGWSGRGVAIGDNGPAAPAHQGRACAWFPGGRQGALLQQTVRLPAGAGSAWLTFWLHLEPPIPVPGAQATLALKARGEDGHLALLASYSTGQAGLGYQQYGLNLGAYRGQRVQLSFVASGPGPAIGFALDDLSLIAP